MEQLKQKDIDYLCDIAWYLRGYKAATDAKFDDCPFNSDHLRAIETIILILKKEVK